MIRHFQKSATQHQQRIYTFACYLLRNREDAEEVTQDVLLRLWRNYRTLRDTALSAWLVRVTRNACLDVLRKRQRDRHRLAAGSDSEAFTHAVDTGPNPEAIAEASDFQQQVERALGELSEPHRTIVILREIQDLTYEQIAEALDLPLNTLKVYLHRGRKMLRDALREKIKHDEN